MFVFIVSFDHLKNSKNKWLINCLALSNSTQMLTNVSLLLILFLCILGCFYLYFLINVKL